MEIKLIFSDNAKAVYEYVSNRALSCKSERIMYNAIMRKLELIKRKPDCGTSITKKLIPKEYITKYDVKNLYRIELPMFWRILYTIKGNKVEVIAFVLDIINHKEYNKRFGY